MPGWEHGYRCHGYWLGTRRIGFIGIGPFRGDAEKHGYYWSFDLPTDEAAKGRAKTLRAAKREIERCWNDYSRSNQT